MDTPDVLIIGGGIIGCTLARELTRARSKVVVLEAGRAGQAASAAAAGLLAPGLSTAPAGPLLDLCFDSAAIYEDWLNQLHADGASDVGFRRAGMLDVWLTSEERELHIHQSALHQQPVEMLTAEELAQREPALRSGLAGAAYHPDAAQVDAALLSHQTVRVAALAGVVIRENEPVQRLVRDGDHVREVHTNAARYRPGIVVVTAGAWTGGVLDSLGVSLPTRPVKGQLLLADSRLSLVHTPLHSGDVLIAPRPDGTVLLGVTVEETGFDTRVTMAGLHAILAGVLALAPGLGDLTSVRSWAGLRPATPDDLPYMGPLPPLHNLWISAGHFRKGILLAPLCARLMAQSILAGHLVEDLAPFKPTRRLP
jgi:glycine oxidase